MELPLRHPACMARDRAADKLMFEHVFAPVIVPKKRTLAERVRGRLKRARALTETTTASGPPPLYPGGGLG